MRDTFADSAFVAELDRLSFTVRRMHALRPGERVHSRRSRLGMEFHSYLPYQPGMDARPIDWNVYRRHRSLVVRTFVGRSDFPVYVIMDHSGSMRLGYPSKLDLAKRLAAALSFVALTDLHTIVLLAFGQGRVQSLGPGRGRAFIESVLDFLERQEPEGPTRLRESLETCARELWSARSPRGGKLILLSDMLDEQPYADGLDWLLSLGLEVDLLHLRCPEDQMPPVPEPVVRDEAPGSEGGTGSFEVAEVSSGLEETARTEEFELRCAETGNRQPAHSDPAWRRAYSERLRRYQEELEQICNQRGILRITADTTVPWQATLRRFFDPRCAP